MRIGTPDEFVVYCEDPPEFEFRPDGMGHVTYRVGGFVFHAVMRPSTFNRALRDARARYDDWRVRQSGKIEDIGHAARS